jgi:hypothetical protein
MLLIGTYTCSHPFSHAWRHPSHHATTCPTPIPTIQPIFKILTPKFLIGNSANCCPPSNFHTPTIDGKNNMVPYFYLLQRSMQSNDVQLQILKLFLQSNFHLLLFKLHWCILLLSTCVITSYNSLTWTFRLFKFFFYTFLIFCQLSYWTTMSFVIYFTN